MSRGRIEAALEYSARGWRVLPLQPGKKRPFYKTGRDHLEGSTTDPEAITQRFERYPSGDVGIVAGTASGFLVIDVDGPTGETSLSTLEAGLGPLPEAPEARTPRADGGRHLYFAHPGGVRIKSRPIAEKLDCKADGGLVVAPGAPGSKRTWTRPPNGSLPELPEAWLPLLAGTTSPAGDRTAPSKREIPGGGRNQTLFELGAKLRGQEWELDEIEAHLLRVNAAECRPPLSDVEVQKIAKSAASYAAKPPGNLLTERGNAERLVRLHGESIRYCHPWRKWMVWDGRCWARDDRAHTWGMVGDVARELRQIAANHGDKTVQKAIWKHSQKTDSARGIRDTLAVAASMRPVVPSEFDTDPMALNVANGVIDLTDGTLRAHDPKAMITKLAPVALSPGATAPRWEEFLQTVFNGNRQVIDYVKKAVGYSVTGTTGEQVFFVLWGTGANGKSTFLETIRAMLGTYSLSTRPEAFMVRRNADQIPPELADMAGARFVVATEGEQGQRLAEAMIKRATGGEEILAKRLYEDPFTFQPQFKLWLGTNHKPRVRGADLAVWRRIRLIPFTVTIPEPERDPSLRDKLDQERPGILRWALEGLAEWREYGLGEPPEEVKAATAGYRAEEDLIAGFLGDCCHVANNARVRVGDLHKALLRWWESNGDGRPPSKRALGVAMTDKGFDRYNDGGARYYIGVGLADYATDA